MDINDIKHLAVERIYLVPDASEGQLGYVWCDDPAPSDGMVASEAVEYVRKDVHEAIIAKQAKAAIRGMDAAKAVARSNLEQAKRLHAESNPDALESERAANALLTERIAQLEAECAAHKAAEETQIALRQKADEREAALAAHVESLHEALEQALIHWGPYCTEEEGIAYAECMRRLDQVPTISLARRDLIQRAVGLEDALKACESSEFAFSIKGFLYHKANKLRQQAEQ